VGRRVVTLKVSRFFELLDQKANVLFGSFTVLFDIA
jgi:hypothetical protein